MEPELKNPYIDWVGPELDAVRYADVDDFTPDVSPRRMLELGVYDGYYFRGNQLLVREFPEEWFTKARWAEYSVPSMNMFGVASRPVPYEEWSPATEPLRAVDGLGWFQWYCRFHNGRRLPDVDGIQIRRWASARERLINLVVASAQRPNDQPRRRQELLHWGCDPYPEAAGRRL